MTCSDVVFSFDTTGSMYTCLREVRRHIINLTTRLFEEIPNIRIGIIAHGDYCDEQSTYLMKFEDLTNNAEKICTFVNSVEDTHGGDFPEAYEYVLHKAQNLSWNSDTLRALVIIGDAYPHEITENPYKLDWRKETDGLKEMGINIYGIQCLDRDNPKCNTFYKQIASKTNGFHLKLHQFSYIRDIILAICFRQESEERLQNYEQEVKTRLGGLTNNMRQIFDTMLNRTSNVHIVDTTIQPPPRTEMLPRDTGTINPCPGAKFQILNVESNCSIKEFVQEMGLIFKTGRGFYEFTKPEKISSKKDIILMKKESGELFEGSGAKTLVGISTDEDNVKKNPSDIEDFRVFIQSTSYNRKLIGGTGFLYEVDGWVIDSP
jgi:hypothetical protein